jgi:hypothetical protein
MWSHPLATESPQPSLLAADPTTFCPTKGFVEQGQKRSTSGFAGTNNSGEAPYGLYFQALSVSR